MRVTFRATLILLFTFAPRPSFADVEECQEAISSYNAAINDVSDTLRRYSRCISDSHGHDDCSSEFNGLHSAQDDFESAVSSYESDCQ